MAGRRKIYGDEKLVRLVVKIPVSFVEKLENEAQLNESPVSAVVRKILKTHFEGKVGAEAN